jgi:hypothetical protein
VVVRYVTKIAPYRRRRKVIEGLAVVAGVVASIAAFGVLAVLFGRDTRDGNDWIVHRAEPWQR